MTIVSPTIEHECIPLSQLGEREKAVVHMTELDADEQDVVDGASGSSGLSRFLRGGYGKRRFELTFARLLREGFRVVPEWR